MSDSVRVKICGLTHPDLALHAFRAGADFLGAILSEGFGRSISPVVAREFVQPDGPPLVGVFVDEPTGATVAKARQVRASVLQLHGDESPATLGDLRREGRWEIWKVVRPRTSDELSRAAERYAEHADALHLDTWHHDHVGGSGIAFPWDVVEKVRADLPPGLMLVTAGGLTPDSVADAIARISPDVVDVSTGVESARGQKDPAKVEAFIRAAHAAARDGAAGRAERRAS
jgi:phosphoribosylanthranilate isomerase